MFSSEQCSWGRRLLTGWNYCKKRFWIFEEGKLNLPSAAGSAGVIAGLCGENRWGAGPAHEIGGKEYLVKQHTYFIL